MIEAHRSAQDMARCLATYIDSPERIQREVATVWDDIPHVTTIRAYRSRYLRDKAKAIPCFDRAVITNDEKFAREMRIANIAFLTRMYAEHGVGL